MPFVAAWEKVLCPFCFEQFHPGDTAVMASDGTVIKYAPRGVKQAFSRIWIPKLDGNIIVKLPRRLCPNCNRPWPVGMEFAENHIIAVVGSTGAGKSNYIAMAIHQLTEGKTSGRVRQAMDVALIVGQSQQIEDNYRKIYQELVRDKQALLNTPPLAHGDIAEPLIYRLVYRRTARERRPVYIYLYDVGGEEFRRAERTVEFAKFLFHASALILLADPLAMPGMRQYIHHMYYPNPLPDIGPSALLYRALELYESHHKGKLSIPIAITVSKSDLLQFADQKRKSSVFATPSYYDQRYTHPVSLQELAQVSGDVHQLLRVYGDAALVDWMEEYERVGYFAVSATGWSPDPTTLAYPAIEPLRCLDPLLWVLHQINVIQAE